MTTSYGGPRLKHSCSALCKAEGTCKVETIPHLIESTSTRQNKSFQYTKVSTFELYVSSL